MRNRIVEWLYWPKIERLAEELRENGGRVVLERPSGRNGRKYYLYFEQEWFGGAGGTFGSVRELYNTLLRVRGEQKRREL